MCLTRVCRNGKIKPVTRGYVVCRRHSDGYGPMYMSTRERYQLNTWYQANGDPNGEHARTSTARYKRGFHVFSTLAEACGYLLTHLRVVNGSEYVHEYAILEAEVDMVLATGQQSYWVKAVYPKVAPGRYEPSPKWTLVHTQVTVAGFRKLVREVV